MPPEQTPNLGGDRLDRSYACRKLGELEVAQVGTSEERAAVLNEGVAIPLEGSVSASADPRACGRPAGTPPRQPETR